MRTVFRHCVLANFAVDVDVLARALPAPIEPAVAHDRAWLSVVIAQMERMRPAFAPECAGVTYNQIVYRAVVECRGRRGVHFLRSDANSRVMSVLGNALSFFRFHHGMVEIVGTPGTLAVAAASRDEDPVLVWADFDLAARSTTLPSASRFADMASAKAFLVELFDAYHPLPRRTLSPPDRVGMVSIERNDWKVHAVPTTGTYSLMDDSALFPPGSAALDSIFVVEDLHYRWRRLRVLR